MALSSTTKSAINLGIPTLAAGIALFLCVRSKMSWKVYLIIAAVVFLVTWVITSKVTNIAYLSGPAPVPTGGGCDSYDPTAIGDAIHTDLTCVLCFRNEDVYTQLLALADCQLIKLYNYYNSKYYGAAGSLPQAIAAAGDTLTSLSGTFTNVQKPQIADRFNTLNLQ